MDTCARKCKHESGLDVRFISVFVHYTSTQRRNGNAGPSKTIGKARPDRNCDILLCGRRLCLADSPHSLPILIPFSATSPFHRHHELTCCVSRGFTIRCIFHPRPAHLLKYSHQTKPGFLAALISTLRESDSVIFLATEGKTDQWSCLNGSST